MPKRPASRKKGKPTGPIGAWRLPWPALLLPTENTVARSSADIASFKEELKAKIGWPAPRATGIALRRMPAPAPPANIVGVGFGAKRTNGLVTSIDCVRVYVQKKLPKSKMRKADIVPSEINGRPTDVIEAQNIRAYSVPCGVSVGHFAITAGTLGCLVKDGAGNVYILSNNHVLANCNSAKIGDAVLQPGPYDWIPQPPPATPPTAPPPPPPPWIATLSAFQPLDFGPGPNLIDAAIARLVDPTSVSPSIDMIGPVSPAIASSSTGMPVKKTGRTTHLTSGNVEGLDEDIGVSYDSGTAQFAHQIAVQGANAPFSQGGDSGSLIVTANGNQPLALLFAGDSNTGLTFGSPLAGILTQFGVSIV